MPSLEEWVPAADAAVKGVAAQLAHSRHYHPMLLSAATAGALPAAGGNGGGMVSGLLEFIDLDSVIVADSGNPIADLAALGHGLLNAALAAVTALMGAATGSGLLESIPFIGKGLDVFESAWQVSDALVSTLLGLLIVAGAVRAYVLPALPFIRFLFGILDWILNVAIAVLAVTVFAAAHVTREDGNRLIVNATRQGWLFLPALVLRPALMLLGLILGYFVFLAAIGLFNQVWLPQMRDAGASGGLGPVGFLAMLALYVKEDGGSNFSTIANQLAFQNYPEVAANIASSSFDPLILTDGDTDLFVVAPEETVEHVKGLLRQGQSVFPYKAYPSDPGFSRCRVWC